MTLSQSGMSLFLMLALMPVTRCVARNMDDRAPLKDKYFTERLFGKLFADRGYISQSLFESVFVDDIHLVMKVKKNMKNSLMNLYDKLVLRKRALIETVNDELKNVCQIEYKRHRSIDNFATNLFRGLLCINCYRRNRL